MPTRAASRRGGLQAPLPNTPPRTPQTTGHSRARNLPAGTVRAVGTDDPSRAEFPARLIEQRRHGPAQRGLVERLVRAPAGLGVVSLKALEELNRFWGSPRNLWPHPKEGFSLRRVPCTTAPMTLRNKPSVRLSRVYLLRSARPRDRVQADGEPYRSGHSGQVVGRHRSFIDGWNNPLSRLHLDQDRQRVTPALQAR